MKRVAGNALGLALAALAVLVLFGAPAIAGKRFVFIPKASANTLGSVDGHPVPGTTPGRGGLIDASLNEIVLQPESRQGAYASTQAMGVAVGGTAEPWLLTCSVEPPRNEGGESPVSGELRLILEKGGANGSGVAATGAVDVASGGSMGAKCAEVNRLRLTFACAPETPPGLYTGLIRLVLTGKTGRTLATLTRPYKCHVDEVLDIAIEPQTMDFGSVQQGPCSSQPVHVTVVTNKRNVKLNLQVDKLLHEDGKTKLPAGTVVLDGTLPGSGNGRVKPTNKGGLVWNCVPGRSQLTVVGEADVKISMPAGAYHGEMLVDVQDGR